MQNQATPFPSPTAERVDPDNYQTIPALADYLHRIACEADLEVEQRNFKRFALIDDGESGYRKDVVVVSLKSDGTVICPQEELAPTENEAAAIKEAFSKIKLPRSMPATIASAENQQCRLKIPYDDWFVFPDHTRNQVLMCQQQVEKKDGSKSYLPWTFWSDGTWRRMESDDGSLPMWKPAKRRNKFTIMVHEGAKAARYVDWLVNDLGPDAQNERAAHPWANELAKYEHYGWIGGASNSQRTDWSKELLRDKPFEIVIVADNDLPGKQAIPCIAQALKSLPVPVFVCMFDDAFAPQFDLADPFPKDFWSGNRYRGPTLADCCRPATWATKVTMRKQTGTKTSGKPPMVVTAAFAQDWLAAVSPSVFVNRHFPNRLLDSNQFNAMVAPFSDAQDTAAILRKEAAAQVDSIAYEPGRNQGIITIGGLRAFNTFQPTRIAKHKGDVTPWIEFTSRLFPREIDRNHCLRWCATLIARRKIRMRYGILLISETQGVGKGTLMEKILAPLVGWQNVSVPSEKQLIESSFNSWIVRRRLVLVHEIYAGHSKKAYDTIKSCVSDDTLTVNEKNRPEYEINNWAHFVLSSNSPLALRLVQGDRRWLVPEVTEDKPPSPEYWVELNSWLCSGGLEAIHHWAEEYVEEHGAVGEGDEPPSTAAKIKLIEVSRSEGMQMVHDLGEIASRSFDPIILKDRDVRIWLAGARRMELTNPNLESLLTIRTMLKQTGMVEICKSASGGMRWFAFGNQKAIEVSGSWDERKNYVKKPDAILPI